MLLHIWTTPGLAKQVRDEINIYAKATQPPRDFGIPEPPRLKIDIDGLVKSCPLLKACFYECVRLYSTPTSVRTVSKDIIIRGDHGDGVEPPKSSLDAGSIIAASSSLHHYDPDSFKDPKVFRPIRYLKPNKDGKGQQTFVAGTIKPWGIGESACPGRDVAEKQVLAFVAGILALWDFEPANNKEWVVPDQVERTVISVPAVDIRIRLRPRELL
jgi:cytochrome P450